MSKVKKAPLTSDELIIEEFGRAAKEAGSNASGQEYYDQLKNQVAADRENGIQSKALATVANILLKVAVMEINGNVMKVGETEFYNKFIRSLDANMRGSGKEYIEVLPQIGGRYDANQYIPNAETPKTFEYDVQTFRNQDGQLSTGSYQYKFRIVIIIEQLADYFIMGRLSTFYNELVLAQIKKSRDYTVVDMVYKNIQAAIENNKGKVVNGTASNAFDCLTTEIFPEIRKMKLNSSAYNYDSTSLVMNASKKEDLLIIASTKTLNTWFSTLKVDSFVYDAININQLVGGIHECNYEMDFSNNDKVIRAKATQYIDDNTIIVIDTRYFLSIIEFLKQSGTAQYIENMAMHQVMHYWVNAKNIKWGKCLIYKNQHLNTNL